MERLYDRFQDRIEFFVVYVQEAHPTDGWQVDSNIQNRILYRQHQSFDEREEAPSLAPSVCTFRFQSWWRRWTTLSTKRTVRPRNDCI